MMVLGITGGMASGKSFVSRLITKEWHIPVYDTDTEAKRLNNENITIRHALTQLVGANVYDIGGSLQKQVLANYLFSCKEHAAKVNAIVHPVVRDDFLHWKETQVVPVVAMESAILFESGFYSEVDKVLYVDAPKELRIHRAIERDKSSLEQIQRRILLQNASRDSFPIDFLVWNENKNERELISSLRPFIESLFDGKTDVNNK